MIRGGIRLSVKPTRRRVLAGALITASLVSTVRHAGAVIILDSTWRAEGGRPGNESEGFGAHAALAKQPQFAGVIPLSHAGDDDWSTGSGTWVGNFEGAGYVLTAAHIWDRGGSVSDFDYRAPDGTALEGTHVKFHPLYDWSDNRQGYDFALVKLEEPITNAGAPPLLYAGDRELGQRIVMVGYGARGIGSFGQKQRFRTHGGKAAAENVVDEVMAAARPAPRGEDAGNWFRCTLRRESEGAGRLDGLLGSGDSGGPTWLRSNGQWAIAGVNGSGTGNAGYGDSSYFARVSGVRDWLTGLLPGLRFTR